MLPLKILSNWRAYNKKWLVEKACQLDDKPLSFTQREIDFNTFDIVREFSEAVLSFVVNGTGAPTLHAVFYLVFESAPFTRGSN